MNNHPLGRGNNEMDRDVPGLYYRSLLYSHFPQFIALLVERTDESSLFYKFNGFLQETLTILYHRGGIDTKVNGRQLVSNFYNLPFKVIIY